MTTNLPPLDIPPVDLIAILPFLFLSVAPLVLLLMSAVIRSRPPGWFYAGFTTIAGGAALAAAVVQWSDIGQGREPIRAIAGSINVDGFAVFLTGVIAIAVILGGLLAAPYLEREGLNGPEFAALMCLSASGGVLMVQANDLIVIFLGLEILSIALYVMAGYHARRIESGEAAMKYFVLGAFSSALFLYGIAMIYGGTGSTNLTEIASFLAQNTLLSEGTFLAGVALILVGLGFKVAAVPFHVWTPDVYQGSPTPATAFMAAAAKAAGFGALLRVFSSTFGIYRLDWQPVIFAIAVLTLVVGSVLALVQTDVKRMLAYSSVSHAGYILIGLQAGTRAGISGALFYILAYTFIVIGSFAVVMMVGRTGDARHNLDEYRGLSKRRPLLAFVFTVLLLAQAGVPLTSGFMAKFYVIRAVVEQGNYALALVGMLVAALATFLYLRVVVLMYMSDAEAGADTGRGSTDLIATPATASVALGLAFAFTVAVGFIPGPVVELAQRATILF